MENESTGEFNLNEAADEIIAQESDSGSASTEASSQSEGQSAQDSQLTGEKKELSPEDILKQVGEQKENPEQFAEILKAVNGMGLVGNGLPINIDSPEHLKKLLEMGAGFYAKTEEHANIVKAREAEFTQKETHFKEREGQIAQKEQDISDQIEVNQIMSAIVSRLKTEDPELFEHLDKLFINEDQAIQKQNSYRNQFQNELKTRDEKINSLAEKIDSKEKTEIRQGFEKEMSEAQSKHAANLSKLGIKADWNGKIKELWASDASEKMTPEQALFAVHGKEIASANESYQKLLATKNKTQEKLINRTGINAGQRGGEETIRVAPGDYDSILREAAATM